MQQNTSPDGGYFSNIDPSDIFDENSNNDADHVDDNKDDDLDNFDVNKNEGFNKYDADANQDIFDADNDNPIIFDEDDIDGIEDVSLSDVNDGFFSNDSSEAKSNNYAHSKKEEVEQLVKMVKTLSEVCPVWLIYNKDGVLESQTYDENLRDITHDEMERYVANGGQQLFDNAMARRAHREKACNEKKTLVSIVVFWGGGAMTMNTNAPFY